MIFSESVTKMARQAAASPVVSKVGVPAWNFIASLIPMDLTYSDATHWISLEITSKCNLRCVYCSKGFDQAEQARLFDFPEEWLSPALRTLRRRGLIGVIASGIGETTIRKGWREMCAAFLGKGLDVTIITNFSRSFKEEDLATLVRFNSIQVSVDTIDPVLFSQLRKGGSLALVLSNIKALVSYAQAKGLRCPTIQFAIVVCDKTVHGMEQLVRVGLAHGVSSFYFANLVKGADSPGNVNAYNVTTLPTEDLARGRDCLDSAILFAREAGASVTCHAGLTESIQEALRTQKVAELFPIVGKVSWGAPTLGEGMTRDCADPWKYVDLTAEGDVWPCCAYPYSIGNLNDSKLEEVLNGDRVRGLRRDLLSGNIKPHLCAQCSMKSPIGVGDFKKKMAGRLLVYSIRRRLLNLLN